jgi:hypothetical protein
MFGSAWLIAYTLSVILDRLALGATHLDEKKLPMFYFRELGAAHKRDLQVKVIRVRRRSRAEEEMADVPKC